MANNLPQQPPADDHWAQLYQLQVDVSDSPYYNHDLAPTKIAERRWGTWDIAALWVGMSACIPSYMLASGLIEQGMNWWQAVLTVTLGNIIILLPMLFNAHAGTKFGIPFPVYCRVSFGILGANIAAMLRALVACGWFGIQTWIGGLGFYALLTVFFPAVRESPQIIDGANAPQLICFGLFWAINIAIIYAGMESIRWFMNLAAPILIGIPIAMLIWAYNAADGWEPILAAQQKLQGQQDFWQLFIPGLTGIVGFWSTLALNIPDFMRYAKSQKDQLLGQAIGMPTTMGLYALIGVLVTCATIVVYKEPIWDPIALLSKFQDQPVVVVIAAIAVTAATLSTNIAANVVGPANDFANLLPKLISFKTGGLITGIIGIVMCPWKLMQNANYYFNWLGAYGALLGAIGGILICDYYFIRRRWIALPELYRAGGAYWYRGGYNPVALFSLALGISVCLPGFLHQVQLLDLPSDSVWVKLYGFAWFISFGIAGLCHTILMRLYYPQGKA